LFNYAFNFEDHTTSVTHWLMVHWALME